MKTKSLLLLLMLALGLPWVARAQKTLPYEYGFENNDLTAEGWSLQNCQESSGINTDSKKTGSYGFCFYYTETPPQYLISPELTASANSILTEFYYKNYNSYYPETFQVGYSTTTNAIDQFHFGDVITASNQQWTLYSNSFPTGTKYVAVKCTSNYQFYLYLDDFHFEAEAPYPKPKNLVVTTYSSTTATLNWTVGLGQDHWDIYYSTNDVAPDEGTTPTIVNTTTKPYTITGLESGITYYAYVRGNYNNGEHYSDWSDVREFEIGCFTPINVQSMVAHDQAYIYWNAGGAETSWQVAHSNTQGFTPNDMNTETVTDNYLLLEDLGSGVTYYAKVRSVCGEGDYSEWSDECSFTPTCQAPTSFVVTGVNYNSATLSWYAGAAENEWEIAYSTDSDFNPDGVTPILVDHKPYTLTGLTTNTTYYAYVRAACSSTDHSAWSNKCSFTPIYSITVNADSYPSYLPIYIQYANSTQSNQYIIPSGSLQDLLYANIDQLQYYTTNTTTSWNDANAEFEVYLGEMEAAQFTGGTGMAWSDMTLVYSGHLAISGGVMTVDLSQSYQYQGENLVVGFKETTTGTGGSSILWIGAIASSSMALYDIDDNGYSPTSFIPKTTLLYTPGTAPTCLKPNNLASSNVGATSATLSWTNGDTETAWVLQYATDANFTQNVVSVNVTTNPYTLAGLTPETTYYARVKADCGGDDYSSWSNTCSFMPTAIQTIVINDGTNTSYYVPFYGYSANTQYMKSQFIIPSTELTDVLDKQITKLTFHTNTYYPTATFPDGVFKVYLLPTELTAFSSYTPVDWSTLTEVYSGEVSVSNNKMEIALSAPYVYSGGNLLVGFEETNLSSSSSFLQWLGVTTENYAAYYYAGSNSRAKFLPKMTITYSIILCAMPTNLVINATSNAATLTWTPGDGETNWNVQYKASSASDWSEVIAVEDTPACAINGLSASTDYQVRIQADCGSGMASPWLAGTFATACGYVGLPYSYDFSDVAIGANGAYPQCWTRINNSGNSNYDYYPFVTANNKVLKFLASANANAPTNQIAVMPEITEDINTLRMSFKAYLSTGSNKTLTVGVMTDPNDASTFTKVVDVVVRSTGTSVFYPISLEGYQGVGHYIAFKCDKLASGSDYSIFIDNITVETVPTIAPVNLPYSYNFDNATTGYNAFPPDEWHFSNTYYPYVYESASMAYSGSNFLMMQKPSSESACYAALPPVNTTENPINTLKLTFWARMWNSTSSYMYLSIGVMTDPSDINTYQFISSVSVRNEYSMHEIYFDDYAGEGQYIVLRCYNNSNYFCVDDIEVSVAPTCRQPLDLSTQYTTAHEAEIRWKSRDLRQCNYQVSYSTDVTFDPADGTIVDVEFENTLVNAGTPYRDYYLTCLNANTTYYYYVRANCGNDDFSEWSNDYASLTTGEPCPEPYGFYANTVKNTYAKLQWYGDFDEDWDFRYKKTTDENWTIPTEMELMSGEGSEIIYRLTGLEPGTEYEAQLRRHCGIYSCPAVDDGYSNWVSETFTTGTGCSEPEPWMCLTHMGTSAKLEWYQTGEETRWQIRYRLSTEYDYPAENIVLTDEMTEARKQRWTITNLQTNSMYYWQVRAYCDSENQSDWSDESYFFTGGEKVTVDKANPFYEDFEGVSGMPDGWMRCNQYNYDLNYFYPWSYTPAEGPSWDERPGNHGMYNNSDDYHGSTSVLTPEMHIDGNAYSAKLSFWDYCDYGPSAISGQNISYGSMQVMVSSDHGETFDYAWWSFGPKRYWHQFFVDLDEYIGRDIIIRFDYWWANNNPNFDWYIDDVKVQVFDNAFGSGSGITSGDWNDPDMWGNGTPDGDDDVIINANVTIPDGVVAEANNIVINTDTINTGGRAQKFGKLTIANGGQLITNNAVEVTAQKSISPWTTNPAGGWHFIASPLSEAYTPAGSMVSNTYDLYRLNNTTWENFKNTVEHADFTSLVNGKGYLYANSDNVTLEFAGEIKTYEAGNNTVAVTEGWNLIGNPYTFKVYPNTSYYVLNGGRTGLDSQTKSSGVAVPPCTGIIVKALDDGEVTFSKEAPVGQTDGGSLQIILTKANTRSVKSIDNAIVSFNQGDELPKFYFGESSANVYIPMNGEEYAIVTAEVQGELPLNFKAIENGSYTLGFNSVDTEFSYLHLIDNLTGNDIDLLETTNYTFDARYTDYASRFKLIFVKDNADWGDDFAFFSNGQIIVRGNGVLQIIDVMGRVIENHEANDQIVTDGMTPGVYVLRLIDGDNVKNQKIIIK